jgi:pimeloyl-ACP methyl ester carboxylesterase
MIQSLLLLPVLLLAALYFYSVAGARQAEREFPPIGELIEIDGIRLHYLDRGEGPTIVLLHGASASLRDFQASLLPALADRHRVIAFDRPGYGYSDRPNAGWPDPAHQARLLRDALRRLGARNPVIVGHSWSGSVVLAYLLDYPGETAGGVLLAGGSHPWKGGVDWYNHVAGWPLIGPLFASTIVYPVGRLKLESAAAAVFAPNPLPKDYIRQTAARLALRPGPFLASTEDVRNLSGFLSEQSRRYHEIQRPLLLITGDADTIVPPPNHADRLVKTLPKAELVVLPDTGHAPHHVHTETISRLIGDFAERTANGSSVGS